MSKNRWLLQELAAPLAKRPINEITPAEILVILKRIEKTGRRETARTAARLYRDRVPLRHRNLTSRLTTRHSRFAAHY